MNKSGTVSAELSLKLVVPQQGVLPLRADLSYTREDPYAIRVVFRLGSDEPVEWVFARDLLSAGAEGETGEGDVRVWPSAGVLNVRLISPFGEACFEAPADDVAAFLRRSYQLVPAGAESAYLDIESGLTGLLDAF